MNNLLLDMYKHQCWADAEHWKALERYPSALEDNEIKNRLYHIEIVQHGFLSVVSDEQFVFTKPEDFPTSNDLKEYSKLFHNKVLAFIKECPEARFNEMVTIPWFKDPPLTITIEKALLQCAMHSHYHRATNAARLRELGGIPPYSTDIIFWYWKGSPEAIWE